MGYGIGMDVETFDCCGMPHSNRSSTRRSNAPRFPVLFIESHTLSHDDIDRRMPCGRYHGAIEILPNFLIQPARASIVDCLDVKCDAEAAGTRTKGYVHARHQSWLQDGGDSRPTPGRPGCEY